MDLKQHIPGIPDFPKPGILFRDITPLLRDPDVYREVENRLVNTFAGSGVTVVAGVESRGFLFGIGVAQRLGVGFVPIRKQGKLPGDCISESYALEYGEATLEIHRNALGPGDKVLIIDDLLATGGTAEASAKLVEQLGAEVAGLAFVIELTFLNGRAKLGDRRVVTLVQYDSEE